MQRLLDLQISIRAVHTVEEEYSSVVPCPLQRSCLFRASLFHACLLDSVLKSPSGLCLFSNYLYLSCNDQLIVVVHFF